jgi:hypothetical protein
MSIAGDLLTTATPARLLCRRGTWVLEIVRLVPIERNVFQPRVQRLEGAEAVLQYLKRSGDSPALAAAAGLLMRAPRTEEERSFDAVEGEWVPGEASANRESTRPSAPPPGNASEALELRAELLVLRASHEQLRERVQRLEAQLSRGESTREVLSVPPIHAALVPKLPDAQPAPEALASTSSQGQKPAKTQSERAATERPMRLPDVASINACLQSLIGDSTRVREKNPVSFSAGELGARWLSRLIDETGHDVGAIVSDQAASATLGGALMRLPEHEIEAQRAHEMPSQDVIGAMSEVANQLCETINQAGGVHVRVKPIEQLSPGALDWTKTASGQLELELADGFGRLFLFAR